MLYAITISKKSKLLASLGRAPKISEYYEEYCTIPRTNPAQNLREELGTALGLVGSDAPQLPTDDSRHACHLDLFCTSSCENSFY